MIPLLFTILVGAAVWWYRLKMVRDAGAEIVDVFGKARGQMRRNKLRGQSEESPIAAIDNPVIAAASLLVGLVTTSPLPPVQEEIVRKQLKFIAKDELLVEAMVYAQWVQTQPLDSRKSTLLLCEKLNDWLSYKERCEIVDMLHALGLNSKISLNKNLSELAARKLTT